MLDDPLCCLAVPVRRNRAFSHCLAINRASTGDSLSCSVPTNFLVPIVTVEGFSILSRRAKLDTPHGGFLGDADDIPRGIDQRIDIRRNLHEIGPSLCDQINRHEPNWMARWPSSRETVAMTLWPIYDWENTRPKEKLN